MLLFGKNPKHFFPRARIRFVRYEGTEARVGARMNVIKDVMFEGRILQVTEKALEFVGSQIVEAFMLYATIRNTKLGGNCGGTTPVTTTDSTTDTSTVATILAFCAQPKSREEIMTMCGLKILKHTSSPCWKADSFA